MNNKFLVAFVLVLVVASVGAYFVYQKVNKDAKSGQAYEVTETLSDSSGSMGISLPAKEFNNLSDAQKELSYTIQVPGIKIGSEGIAKIKITMSDGVNLDDDLFITYGQGGKPLYEISQTAQVLSYPEDGEKIQSGSVTYNYVQSEFFEESENENAVALGDAYASRSYIFWEEGNVYYQISEYGKVDKDQLVKLADSMKNI